MIPPLTIGTDSAKKLKTYLLGFSDLRVGHSLGQDVLVVLACFEALRRGEVEPRVGSDMVLRDAVAAGVHEPERELGGPVTLLSGGAVPTDGLGVVLGDTFAGGIHKPEL